MPICRALQLRGSRRPGSSPSPPATCIRSGRLAARSHRVDPSGPIGEYAQSALARERVLEHFSRRNGTPIALLRLNYAVEPRYGVVRDIADRVWAGAPVDLAMGKVNLIWQRDANAVASRRRTAAVLRWYST
jgi:nucleoside-diphosphate-sugar epimerase